jgi:ribosomal protein S18 acetylase RimI-like enzyme
MIASIPDTSRSLMSSMPAKDGWVLERAANDDIDELMAWFPDAKAIKVWGGPHFRYPFSRDTFHDDCRWRDMATFCVRDPQERFTAFGQFYAKHERINLARLVVHPDLRSRGIGKRLVAMLMQFGRTLMPLDEYSLFVYRDNTPALKCYESMGFVIRDYPYDDPLVDACFYLTRSVDEGG